MKKLLTAAFIFSLSLSLVPQTYAEEPQETTATPSASASPSAEPTVSVAPVTNEEDISIPTEDLDQKLQHLQEFKDAHPELFARLERHKEHHYPIVEGQSVLPIPYLSLPFTKTDTDGQYDITEGWIYSDFEQSVHGFSAHNGIDYALPYGTPVVAPADGYAMSSYQTFWIKNDDGSLRTYQDKPLRFGLGYFIQMYVPSVNRYIQMAHMSDIDSAVPFSLPTEDSGDWTPTNHTLSVADLKNSSQYVSVKKGQVLGKVGYSGLAWGYEEYSSGSARPTQIDPNTQKSWDEPHIHFEDFWRDQTTGLKAANRDPYGIYSTMMDYPTPDREGTHMLAPLFLRKHHYPFLPKYAD